MIVKNDDNQIVTKEYLHETVSKLATKGDLNDMKNHFDKTFEHYMGFYIEAMDDKIQTFMDGHADIPRQVMILRDRADKNDRDHREFRMKL